MGEGVCTGVCGEDNGGRGKELQRTYARYDFIVVCEVGFAVFAAVDSFGGQVDVVGEAHVIGSAVSGTATWPEPSRLSVRLDSLLYSFVLRLLRWDLNSVL